MNETFGYARVSTVDQNSNLQLDALRSEGCTRIVEDRASGASRNRANLNRMLSDLRPGDVVVVWKLDRIARSLAHLLEVIDRIRISGAHFKCITSPIDTSSPVGTLILQILGSVAEFERSLIKERTLAGLRTARGKGNVGGNPKLKSGDVQARKQVAAKRRDQFRQEVVSRMNDWLPIVRRYRPARPWKDVIKIVNRNLPKERLFSKRQLVHHVRTAVTEGLVDSICLNRSPREGSSLTVDDPAMKIVVVAFRRHRRPTLATIADDLETAQVATARGLRKWPLSSVANLVKHTKFLKLISDENEASKGL